MAWKDRMQAASFRGVAFEVETDDGSFGRRVQVHEYPQRDKPYAEDLGRAAREFSITGFLLGEDYLDQRDKLLEALEKSGPGALVHPWYGEMTVSLKEPARVSHSMAHGGMCTVQMSFIESGELAFPSALESLGAKSLMSADTLQEVATADFASKFTVDSVASFVSQDALQVLNEGFDIVEDGVSNITNLLANPMQFLKDRAAALLPDASSLASEVFGMFLRGESIVESIAGVFGGGGAAARNRVTVQTLTTLARTFQQRATTAGAGGTVGSGDGTISPSRQRINTNAEALNELFARATLVQAAGMTASMPMPVYDDAVKVRDDLTAALDQASMTASDPVYREMQVLRGNVHRDVTTRLAGSARLTTVTPTAVTPALAVAYDQFEDVAREAEIIELNKIRRPGFVAPAPIKVLSA